LALGACPPERTDAAAVRSLGMGEREGLLAAYDAEARLWTPRSPPPGERYEQLGPVEFWACSARCSCRPHRLP
jgi:hypothetical protein